MRTINVVLTDREACALQRIRGERTWRCFFQDLILEKTPLKDMEAWQGQKSGLNVKE